LGLRRFTTRTLVKRTHQARLVGHISRDATAIEAREKPVKLAVPPQPKRQQAKHRMDAHRAME
jgi:hypothetical protein